MVRGLGLESETYAAISLENNTIYSYICSYLPRPRMSRIPNSIARHSLPTHVVIDMASSAVAAANAEMRGCTREDIYNCTLRCIKASNSDLAWRFVAVCCILILVVGSIERSYKSRVP